MENNLWDDQFRDLLGEYKPGKSISPLENHDDVNPTEDASDPDAVEEANPTPEKLEAWKRIEASLEAADHAFDETVRQRLQHFNPKYDPHTWPIFVNKLAESRFLKTKIILLKSFEVAVLLLLLLTAVNMGRHGKLPFESNFNTHDQQAGLKPNSTPGTQPAAIPQAKLPTVAKPNNDFTLAEDNAQPSTKTKINAPSAIALNTAAASNSKITLQSTSNSSSEFANDIRPVQHPSLASNENAVESNTATIRTQHLETVSEIGAITSSVETSTTDHATVPDFQQQYHIMPTEPIASAELTLAYMNVEMVPHPKFVKPINRRYTEFAVMTQYDYNALRMPEDKLYSSGRQIVFPSQGIYSPGYGAGFTVGIGHPIWAIETGVVYNAKNFKPGRQLIVGGAFDNGTVEFEAMKLQMISVPFQFRYRFDHTGRFKAYALAGGGFNVVAQSDIDVQIRYHFASLSFGENPNNDPNLAMTIEETRRLREHIRDGAPLSTKSFVSANAGLGMEFMISEHKTVFLQSILQYQIPNLAFSNNNGKHLRSVSIQAGIRGPLGK